MNTVFKFYLHIWVVFALVAAFAAWYLVFVLWRPRLQAVPHRGCRATSRLGRMAIAVLVVGALIYPLVATPVRLDDRFAEPAAHASTALRTCGAPSTATRTAHRPCRTTTKASSGCGRTSRARRPSSRAATDLYRWGGRFSIYTGLPAVLGWDWHQTQQRGDLGFMVDERRQTSMPSTPTRTYGRRCASCASTTCEYVIVGQVERLYYPARRPAQVRDRTDGALEVVYSNAEPDHLSVKSSTTPVPPRLDRRWAPLLRSNPLSRT